MANRVQGILDAFVTNLTGLTTTTTNVKATRSYNVASTPALTVMLGREQLIEWNPAKVRKSREISILIHVAESEELVDDKILQIEAEIWAALTADTSQGLGYVYDTVFVESTQIETEQGGKVSGQVQQSWEVHYTHSPTSMEA